MSLPLKSYVEFIVKAYEALIRDFKYAYPTLAGEFDLDLARLKSTSEARGLPFFTVDLPALAKHLVQALATEEYVPSGLPCGKPVSRTIVIPNLFRGLYLLIFERDGKLKEDKDVMAIGFLRQALELAKKIDLPCGDDATQKEYESFAIVDQELPVPHEFWDGVGHSADDVLRFFPGFGEESRYTEASQLVDAPEGVSWSILLGNLDKVSGILCSLLGCYQYAEWDFKHGPGSVSDLERYGDRSKYDFSNWTDRLEREFPSSDCAYHNYKEWIRTVKTMARRELRPLFTHTGKLASVRDRTVVLLNKGDLSRVALTADEPSSKMVAVPKDLTKPRLIACEPSEHMWCQQNIWHFLDTKFQETLLGEFVKFHDETQNQRMCVLGSLDGTLCTVDLSAASDRVSCMCVGNLLRRNVTLLRALRATRTRYVDMSAAPHGGDPSFPLRKFSTMGNACTFPIESLTFLAIALAAAITAAGEEVTLETIRSKVGKVSVYGDDIIVPVESVGALYGALEILDFKVNRAKSFVTGRFRESCGVDAFEGVNVTPVRLRRPYDDKVAGSYSSVLDCADNFYKKFFVNTSNYLVSTVTKRWNVPLVIANAGYLGVSSFVQPPEPPFSKVRYNRELQRREYLLPGLFAEQKVSHTRTGSRLLQQFIEARKDPSTFHWKVGLPRKPLPRVRHKWTPVDDLVGPMPPATV